MEFEWDDVKAVVNIKKHGVSFTEATSIWLDENALEMEDTDHSTTEERWVRLGMSRNARLLIVIYVEKRAQERVRIISARKATKYEGQFYER